MIRNRARESVNKLTEWDKSLNRIIDNLEEAREAGNVPKLLRATADLSKLTESMDLTKEQWNIEHFAEVAKYLEPARLEVADKVRPWIQTLVVYSNEHLSKFKHDTLNLSGGGVCQASCR